MDEHMESNSQEQATNKNEKPKSKKGLSLKIIAFAICCSLLGGIIGGGAVLLTGNMLAEKEFSEILQAHDERILRKHMRLRNPFAFRIGAFKDFVEEISHEEYIGITISDSADPKGATVNSVERGSPAAEGGLQNGDVITMVNNARIYNGDELADIIRRSEVGDELKLTVYRQNNTFDCVITVGEHSRFKD